MPRKKGWTFSEELLLKENYNDKTIKELEIIFPKRSREAINNKIKRLKFKKEIVEGKSMAAILRAYDQRGKPIIAITD
jgi:hypothetical protein